MEFEGNTRTRDKVVRREMGIQEGMVLNSGALKNSVRRLSQLEFFKINEEDPVAFEFDNEAKTVDLLIKGEEGERTELMFGGGFSELDGFFGQASFRSRNFRGRGETLGVSIQQGTQQSVFDVSYFVPWFLDRPQSVGIQVFDRSLDYDLLDGQRIVQESTGGTLTYGRNFGLFRRVSLGVSFFDQKDDRRQFNFSGDLVEQNFERKVHLVRLSHNFDRRNSRLEPTVGYAYNTNVDLAGAVLGGTSDYIRGTAGFSVYRPLTKRGLRSVGAFNVELGYIRPINNQDLYFLDRFYLGGQNSVRGFRFRGLWVRDKDGNTVVDEFGYPLGGDALVQFNFEYHLLFGGPFRLIGYFDAGNVFSVSPNDNVFSSGSIDLGDLRLTAGVELRVNVPLFGAPLRFIWAQNLDPFIDDRFESFQFSIGPSF